MRQQRGGCRELAVFTSPFPYLHFFPITRGELVFSDALQVSIV